MSELQKAYKVMQEHCGIEKGDTVQVLRMPTSEHECGWDKSSPMTSRDDRERMIGRISKVTMVSSGGISVCYCPDISNGGDAWPFFCLELVKKAKPEPPPIMVGGNEVKFIKGDIPRIEVCSVSVHKETLRNILERLEN